MAAATSRFPFIDALKAIASQLILLHHLAFYGPLSEALHRTVPSIIEWLAQDARIAVQVFLVIGGFLAAQSLAPKGVLKDIAPFNLIRKRYVKLAIPLIGAVMISIVLSAIARQLYADDAIPASPTVLQILAHATLLHGVLGVDSLSAGVWYIAIDFQLLTLLLAILWTDRNINVDKASWLGQLLVSLFALASLFFFNRNSDWDNWAIYFIGAYALGALTYWHGKRGTQLPVLLALSVIVGAALVIDFRSRILVALLTAIALGLAQLLNWIDSWPQNRLLSWLGKISYSVFLIHFPIILVINGLYVQTVQTIPSQAGNSLYFAALAWIASLCAGALFHRLVETKLLRWINTNTNRQQP